MQFGEGRGTRILKDRPLASETRAFTNFAIPAV